MQAGLLLAVMQVARRVARACGWRANPRTMFTGLTIAMLAACTADSPTAPNAPAAIASAATVPAERVDDLVMVAATDSSVELRWTQVSDGRDRPALYRLKYAEPPLVWAEAAVGCNAKGTAIGSPISCTVQGLESGTTYEFQLMSYRLTTKQWQGAVYSNVARGSTIAHVGVVTDLEVSAATSSALTVSWTEVDDGTGAPAKYRVKYSPPSIDYSNATVGCDSDGTAVGRRSSCTIEGLTSETTYDVQLMSYRTDASGSWEDSAGSNVLTAATAKAALAQAAPSGVWISAAEIASLPTSGADWQRLLNDAARDPGVANIGDQDSQHDVYTLAATLVCVRTGQYCAKARRGVLDAMYTEEDPSDADGDWIPKARWMSVGRNLGSYVIAADLLDLRRGGSTGGDGELVQEWIESFLTKDLVDSNDRDLLRGWEPFSSGSNGAAQQGFAYAAVASYLRDRQRLDFIWEAFRTYVCDPGAEDVQNIDLDAPVRDGWTDATRPCAVNPRGSVMTVPAGLPGAGSTHRVDGSLSADMRRGGVYQWQPGYTQYPWVGLEGVVPAAVVLQRAGYPAFAAADSAVLRTHQYLWWLRGQTGDTRWFDGVRSSEIVHLVNVFYDASFPVNETPGRGRTVGYTGWTHPRR